MSLHHNLLVLNFQLDISHVLHMQGTTQVENCSFSLITPTGSTYFVKKLNINCESWILIGWINKSNNGIGKYQKSMCSPKPLKAGVWHQKFHSVPPFWSANT